MEQRKLLPFLVCVCFLAGLIPREQAFAQSQTACDAYARNYAQNASRQGQVIGTTGSANGLGQEAGSQVVNRHRFHRQSSCGDAVSRW